jgi:predicted ATPase
MEGVFVGREKELGQLYDALASKKSVRLVVGEAGIGKSSILHALHLLLKNENQAKFLVGSYDKRALVGESQFCNLSFCFCFGGSIEMDQRDRTVG